MSHTITIRVQDDLADWLDHAAAELGVSKGQLVREQLEKAKEANVGGQRFMRLAGTVRLDPKRSTRKGFSAT